VTVPAQDEARSQSGDLVDDLASQIADSGEEITDKENEIKSLQSEVAQLRSSNASLTTFHKELTASISALGQAQNKAAAEREEAEKVLSSADEIAGRLAADHVGAIDRAVASVEDESAGFRTEVETRRTKLAEAVDAEIKAKAETAASDVALNDAKQRLGDHAKAIDAEAAQVRSLKVAARDADSKNQDSLAYQVIKEMHVAIAHLDALVDPARAEALQRDVITAWERQAAAKVAEAAASSDAAQARESMKEAQDASSAYEKDRSKTLATLVAESEDAAAAAEPGGGEAA
jgi:hypothetical protein